MTTRRSLVGPLAVVVLAVAGCGSEPREQATVRAEVQVDESPAPAEQEPSGVPMEELSGTEQDPADAAPTWDADAAEEAVGRAVAFLRAFARPDLPAEDWHTGIAGLMTPEGAELFAHVDPANVPARQVTGAAEVLETSTGWLAEVRVDTDAGPYLVTLTRTAATQPWLVEYADPLDQ